MTLTIEIVNDYEVSYSRTCPNGKIFDIYYEPEESNYYMGIRNDSSTLLFIDDIEHDTIRNIIINTENDDWIELLCIVMEGWEDTANVLINALRT